MMWNSAGDIGREFQRHVTDVGIFSAFNKHHRRFRFTFEYNRFGDISRRRTNERDVRINYEKLAAVNARVKENQTPRRLLYRHVVVIVWRSR